MKTFDVLPPECVLPPGVEWCGISDLGPWFISLFRGHLANQEYWEDLDNQARKYVAARCAMWWGAEHQKRCDLEVGFIDNEAWVVHRAWAKLWRGLEGWEC